ncbi:MAG: ATP-cone domain protein [Parcubacteria bacterium 33_209]|nr:MAG: ATP-cone domain protein [Parcubacteria bacterium 33_209]
MKELKKTSSQNLIEVVKFNKEREPFSNSKVYNSALRAGASFSLAKQISLEVENEIYDGIKTAEIFKKVKEKLKEKDIQLSMRFSLKEGIRRLGPEGFLFEDFTKKILSNYCLKIKEGNIVSGKCGRYEIDFLAENNENFFIGECKYRNSHNSRIDINVSLKSFAILEDIEKGNTFPNKKLRSFIVTNTKFTKDAKKYSNCKGIKLLGWKYPEKRGLERLIEEKKLYPVTILPALTKYIFTIFQKEGILLAREVLDVDIDKLSKSASISKASLEKIRNQADILINKR